MNRRLVLVLMLLPCLAAPASAGIIFGKKNKPNPRERVPELIAIVKTDGDENKRASAAEELRHYDPAAFPEVVPVLIDVLGNDKKASVRAEAAQSLGKLRPVSQSAGLALEQAQGKDASMMVRLQARRSLLSYRWDGYRSIKKDELLLPSSQEPPLAEATEPPPAPRLFARKTSQQRLVPQPQPLAQPLAQPEQVVPVQAPPAVTTAPGARPLPAGPVAPPTLIEPPSLSPVPPAEAKGSGPALE